MSTREVLDLLRQMLRVLRKETSTFDPRAYGIQSPLVCKLILWFSSSWNLALTLVALPCAELLLLILTDNLGVNAIQGFHQFTGIWGLRFLVITLFVTPVQTVTRWRGLTRYRQLFGLASFFYAALHLYGYLWIDQALKWREIGVDVLETGYLWPGIFALIVLFLLAATSPDSAKKWLGKRWKQLHRWIYPASGAVVLHYLMQLKGNLVDPLSYGLIIGGLLAFRWMVWFKNRQLARLMIPRRKLSESTGLESGLVMTTSDRRDPQSHDLS